MKSVFHFFAICILLHVTAEFCLAKGIQPIEQQYDTVIVIREKIVYQLDSTRLSVSKDAFSVALASAATTTEFLKWFLGIFASIITLTLGILSYLNGRKTDKLEARLAEFFKKEPQITANIEKSQEMIKKLEELLPKAEETASQLEDSMTKAIEAQVPDTKQIENIIQNITIDGGTV
jgi:hypothetical protein